MPFSQKQMEQLATALQCYETAPKVDYVKFANATGLASKECGRKTWAALKKKLVDEYGALGGRDVIGSSHEKRSDASGSPASTKSAKKRSVDPDGSLPRNGTSKKRQNESELVQATLTVTEGTI